MTKYDVIIIGSGLGGLACGSILCKEGFNVCIAEKNNEIGGNLQTFTRSGVTFDTGMHYMGSMEEGQILHQYFKYFEIADKLRIMRLDKDAFVTVSFDDDDREYELGQDYQRFNDNLLKVFPGEKKALEKHEKEIKNIIRDFPLYQLGETESYALDFKLFGKCATDVFKSFSENQKILNVLAGANTFYPGHADKTPFYVHACVLNSLIDSSWKLIGGSSQIADCLEDTITKYGGTILKKKEVTGFSVKDGKVISVNTSDGDQLFGDIFISNVHPVTTLKILGEKAIKKYYINRIMGLENTQGAFTVHIIFKEEAFPVLNTNYFHYRREGILSENTYTSEWPHEFYFYTPSNEFDQKYADSAVLITYMDYDRMKKWENTRIENRGDDYIAFKNRMAEKLINYASSRFPDLRNSISKYYVSTPLTYRDYTGTHQGSAYGILKDCRDPLRSIIMPRTKIPNLYFTGQNLNLHGTLGVTMSAVITCSELTGLRYLTKKISDA